MIPIFKEKVYMKIRRNLRNWEEGLLLLIRESNVVSQGGQGGRGGQEGLGGRRDWCLLILRVQGGLGERLGLRIRGREVVPVLMIRIRLIETLRWIFPILWVYNPKWRIWVLVMDSNNAIQMFLCWAKTVMTKNQGKKGVLARTMIKIKKRINLRTNMHLCRWNEINDF